MFCIVYFTLLLSFREQEGAVLVEGVRRHPISQKIRILDIKNINKDKDNIRPTDPSQNMLCNLNHTYVFFGLICISYNSSW